MRRTSVLPMLSIVLSGLCSHSAAQDVPLAAAASTANLSSSGASASLDPAWGATAPSYTQQRSIFSTYVGFDLGVPIILDVDHELVRPGVNLHAQGGIDFGFVGAFLHAGWRWIPVDFDRARDAGHESYGGSGRDPLKNPYFGFGVRAIAANASRLQPYASVAFDFNFWNFYESGVACGGYYYWWCNSYEVYRFTPGFSGRVGTAINLGRHLAIDTGVGLSMSFKGDFFEANTTWVEPYLGLTYRN